MLELTNEVLSLDEFQKLLEKAPAIAGREFKHALELSSNKVLAAMVREEPIDTGKLRQSTHINYVPAGSEIKASTDYAYVVHEGTGRSGIPSAIGRLVNLEWAALSPRGRAGLAAHGIKPGKSGWVSFRRKRETKPNPFAKRAFEMTERDVQRYFEDAAERIIESI